MYEITKFLEYFSKDLPLLYDAVINSTNDYIYIINLKERLAVVSDNMATDFELPGRVMHELSERWRKLLHPRDRICFQADMDAIMRGGIETCDWEYQVRNRKEEYLWVRERGRLHRDEMGQAVFFTGVISDLEIRGKADSVTGLLMYWECEKRVQELLAQGAEGGFMLLGLDDFRRINSLNDNLFGDMVLRRLAQDLQNILPCGGSLYRFEGDRFAVVAPGATEREMRTLYNNIYRYCNRRYDIGGISYFCTTSAGLAMMGRDADSYAALFKCADSALRASKRRGKNTSTLFNEELMRAELRAQRLVNQLQISVSNGMEHFALHYQPIHRTGDSRIVGAEALLRWSCDQMGPVAPQEFVPLLEQNGLIVQAGAWVLNEAIRTCKRWLTHCPEFTMNINISYLQLLDPNLPAIVENALNRYGVHPSHIVLEMTESYFVTNIDTLRLAFHRLRAMGISIAMDDFGTGYSSLGLLSRLPADEVKIDRAFISEIDRNDFNRSFIGAVIQLCHSVGITVCVEGVENPNELRTVMNLQADRVQGYQFSAPIPEEHFHQLYWKESLCLGGV